MVASFRKNAPATEGWRARLEEWLSDNSVTFLLVILAIALLALLITIGFFVAYFRNAPISDSTGAWGQFGDYFGGTLNPLFGFLSVMALLAALVIQSRELKTSTAELRNSARALNAQNRAIEHQRFEQTFFAWLQSYNDQLRSIEIIINSETGAERRGRRVLYSWWSNELSANDMWTKIKGSLTDTLKSELVAKSTDPSIRILGLPPAQIPAISDQAMKYWEALYSEWEFHLDSLFRNLYRLFLWIDSQQVERVDVAQKWLYASIVRGQLSWIEMVFLFYNGHTQRGKKFKRLVEKYALFDNLNFGSDAVIGIMKTYPPDKEGYAPEAYDSTLARKALGLPESAEETLALAASIAKDGR